MPAHRRTVPTSPVRSAAMSWSSRSRPSPIRSRRSWAWRTPLW